MAEVIAYDAAKTERNVALSPQSDAEKSTVKMILQMLSRSKKATEDIRKDWPENYRFVMQGEQWPIRRPSWRFSEVVNVAWSNIMTEVGIQTDGRPKVDFAPVDPSDIPFAEILKEINDVNWDKSLAQGYGWQRKVAAALVKCKLYHVVHAEVCWNDELANGLGDVDLKILDPYGSFWDPTAKSIHDCRYFIQVQVEPTSKLRAEYPDFKEYIKPDVTAMDASDGIDDHDIDLYFNISGQQAGEPEVNERGKNEHGGEPMTQLIRCWLKDDTVEQVKEEKEGENGEVAAEYVLKKKYPRGRYIEMACNVVLKDEENQYEDGLFPIATLVNYDYGEYIGENEVTHQKGPQKIVNYTWSHILDQMKMASNPRAIVTNAAHDVVKRLTNEPGLVVEVPEQQDIRFEPGTGIASGMFNILENAISLVDKVSGLQDVTRGAPQPGVTSGLMLEGFVEAAQTRPRLKNRSLDEFLSQVGFLMASRYLQYYTVPRTFRLTNKEGYPEFVEFFVQEDEMTGEKVASVQRTAPDESGQMIQQPRQQMPVKGLPDIKVQSGSALPFARAQKTATALDLYSRQAIDQEELLEAIDWPNAEEVIQRMEEKAAAAAEQEAMMASEGAG